MDVYNICLFDSSFFFHLLVQKASLVELNYDHGNNFITMWHTSYVCNFHVKLVMIMERVNINFVVILPLILFSCALIILEIFHWINFRFVDLSFIWGYYSYYFFTGPYVSYIYVAFALSMLLASLVQWLCGT